MTARRLAAPLTALTCLLGAACGAASGDPEPTQSGSPSAQSGQGPTDLSTATPSPAPASGTEAANPNPDPSPDPETTRLSAPSCPNNSLEGCFTYDGMKPYLQAVLPSLDKFFKSQYAAMPVPDNVWFIAAGANGPTECVTSTGEPASYDSLSFFYCAADKSVYTGQDSLWTYYRTMGDAAPAIAIAHEYGHHIQHTVGVPSPTTREQRINFENQADCIAGVYTAFVNRQGWLEGSDIKDINALLAAIADSEDDPNREHGVLKERTDAFVAGIRGGLDACNAFNPATPVIHD